MRNPLEIRAILLPALLLAAPLARAAGSNDVPLTGDLVNGGKLYRLHCAACHGLGAGGDGPLASALDPKPGAVRDGALLWAKPSEELLATITGQVPVKGMPGAHGRGLTMLDARDVLAWLQSAIPGLGEVFPEATDYIAHKHAIDSFGLDRAEKALGAPLAEEEKAILVYTIFKAPETPEGEKPVVHVGPPSLLSEEPAALYQAKPRRKLGFLVFVPLALDGGTFQVGLAFDRFMHLKDVRTVPASDDKSEALRQKYEKLLKSYVGSGGREEKKPVEPHDKGLKAPKDVQAAMLKGFTRALEGSAMYEKEERDRFWADPDAFKFPEAAEQPDEVKFEFKTKKGK